MILVFDTDGEVFSKLRELNLGLPLWRVTDAARLETSERIDLAIVAADGAIASGLGAAQERPFDTLLLTKRYEVDEALRAVARGFIGYLDIGMRPDALRASIVGCLAGEPGYERRILGRWLHEQNRCARAHANAARLTERQREVLRLIAQGLADKEIGDRLGIATVTAQKHVTNILDRLQVANRAGAVAAVCGLAMSPLAKLRAPRPILAAAS